MKDMRKIKVGSDFSGVGAFDQALKRLGINYEIVFACDMDKYARQTFEHNYGKPVYYPENVYDREIPSESLDIYMTSPPCQAFSLAGKRLGKDDERGILFFNSHEFIMQNKPRFFIFENVKGLLSDNGGQTFNEWIEYLGGKSVNGTATMFPINEAAPYHIYHAVLNAKDFGIPQNRERVFIIGIRDDQDNNFDFPKKERLIRRLKDVLENEVDEKYFLSEKGIEHILAKEGVYTGINESPVRCITTRYSASLAGTFLKIKSATKCGYETATENDSINFSVPSSETRRGRVGKEVAQTLDTACNQGLWIADYRADEGLRIRKDLISPCITSSMRASNEWKPKAGTRNPPLVGYNYKIRRLTPRECFRLMDFPDTFDFSVVSDSQAYKQAGNSICVGVLERIINRLKL